MKKQRVLAYKLATTVNFDELNEIHGGNNQVGPIFIPTLRVTGRPILPDTDNDNH